MRAHNTDAMGTTRADSRRPRAGRAGETGACCLVGALLLLTLGACRGGASGTGDDESGGDTGGVDPPGWLVGAWFHDEGREGSADYADYELTLRPDGSFEWQFGPDVIAGDWRLSGDTLSLNQDFRLGLASGCHVIGLDGKSYIDRSNDVSDCPATPDALSAVEACAVGTFSTTTPNGGTAWYRMDADRTYEELFDDPGYTSGGSSYSRYGDFAIDAQGQVFVTYPAGGGEVRTTVSGLLGYTREGSVLGGCDMAAFEALGGN